nr:MAG TPA: hypothetical protein [Caudoviricetes sp.]
MHASGTIYIRYSLVWHGFIDCFVFLIGIFRHNLMRMVAFWWPSWWLSLR